MRARYPLLMSLCLLALLLPVEVWSLDGIEYMPVDQVQVGMKGVGRTVFSGTRIEEFQVEILGIMRNIHPQGDLILARISGGPLASTGMIQGMSGSPIYIDGKLVGAAAYAWAYSSEPICGITPIEEMLYLWRQMEIDDQNRREESGIFPFEGGEGLWSETIQLRPGEKTTAPAAVSATGLVPIQTPVMVSGFNQLVIDEMTPVLEKYHMNPIQAGSAAGGDEEVLLEPGASLAVQLVGGDVSLSAVGTLTCRDGDRIIAFGHPMFTSGAVDFPMTGAVVHSILPSLVTSFKLASVTGVVGTLRQDRRSGVAGRIGQTPSTLPFDLRIHDPDVAVPESYHFEIIHDQFFSPNLVTWTALNAFLVTGEAMGDATVQMDARFSIQGHPDLHMENIFSGPAPQGVLAADLGEIVALLLRTNLGTIRLSGLALDVTMEPHRREARIASALLDRGTVRPGEDVGVTVFLSPYRGEMQTVRTSLRVPDDAPQGGLILQISDAESSISWEQRRAPHRFQFENIEQLLDVLQGLERNDQLIFKLVTARSGAVIKGQELPSLPPSALAVLRRTIAGGQGGLTYQEVLVEKKLDAGFVLSGQIALPVVVER